MNPEGKADAGAFSGEHMLHMLCSVGQTGLQLVGEAALYRTEVKTVHSAG